MWTLVWYDAHVYSLIFRAKSNRMIFGKQGYHLHGVCGHLEQREGGVHHIVDGVVHFVLCTCLLSNFLSQIQLMHFCNTRISSSCGHIEKGVFIE